MIGARNGEDAAQWLRELQRDAPADATLQNLLAVLNAKLDLCARLPVFAWEAGNDGHQTSASAFRALAEAERRSCDDVLDQLRLHLQQRAGARAAHGGSGQ